MPLPTDRFPYDRPSKAALIRLIQDAKPGWRIYESNVVLGEVMFVPLPGNPGRTFIEVQNLDLGLKKPFFYRRLSLSVAMMTEEVDLTLPQHQTGITVRELVDHLNEVYSLYLEPTDVPYTDEVIKPPEGGLTRTYTLEALPGSYVWYGSVDLNITFGDGGIPVGVRLTESGVPRSTESGEFRLLESAVS